MAPPKKRRKISSAEKKKLAEERGMKSAEKRGKGLGSRKTFSSLPANWREKRYQRGSKTQLQFSSPGKTVYKTQAAVKEALKSRKMDACLLEKLSSDSQDEGKTDDSDYLLSDEGLPEKLQVVECDSEDDKTARGQHMERRLIVCESSQLMDFVQQINDTSKCSTANCNGKLASTFYKLYCYVTSAKANRIFSLFS